MGYYSYYLTNVRVPTEWLQEDNMVLRGVCLIIAMKEFQFFDGNFTHINRRIFLKIRNIVTELVEDSAGYWFYKSQYPDDNKEEETQDAGEVDAENQTEYEDKEDDEQLTKDEGEAEEEKQTEDGGKADDNEEEEETQDGGEVDVENQIEDEGKEECN